VRPVALPGIEAYPLFLVVANLVGLAVLAWSAQRARVPPARFVATLLLCTPVALLGAKVWSLAERGGAYYEWGEPVVPLWRELGYGYRFAGGMLGVLVGTWAVSRWSSLRLSWGAIGDILAPSIGVGVAMSRLGCFLAGCCSGHVTTLPWAMTFPRMSKTWGLQVRDGLIPPDAAASLPVHPLQLYFVAFDLGVAALALWFQSRKQYDGQVLLLFLAVFGLGKAGLELLRYPHAWHVQLVAAALGLMATAVLAARVGARQGAPAVVPPGR
jgi:phosphatidylglycerol:prolipoprotein diacylglycerol transferase